MTTSQKKEKQSSRAKINRMVADGTKNYPSYLKLIYTGDSEFSSDDEGLSHLNKPKPKTSMPIISDLPNPPSLHSSFDHKACAIGPKTEDSLNHSTSKMSESLVITEVLTSPESDKLKDEGKEKTSTPDLNLCQQSFMSSTQPTDLFSNQRFPLSGSWHSFHNDKIVLNKEDEKMELERELIQIQDEISSLRNVLDTKVLLATQLKKRLGVSAMWEIKQGLTTFKQSNTFQKTNAAWKSLGGMASRTMTSIKSSKSFFKTPELQDPNHIKQSMSMADMNLNQESIKASKSVTNVYIH